ncbi:hypothetical protein [Solidesulfovibrio alcoholivorans]|uniref:hypothetical protein n=1 Tax=Solidesulfovibrio alcoholivorans TaxID=81406 RepID=UPI000B25CFE8|nr:hypothetical protein [Solidesulfovibrio alcoholivorans]
MACGAAAADMGPPGPGDGQEFFSALDVMNKLKVTRKSYTQNNRTNQARHRRFSEDWDFFHEATRRQDQGTRVGATTTEIAA